MATKTWKIGEYCVGGIITAVTSGTNVTVIAKEWPYHEGSRRSEISASKCKEFGRIQGDYRNDPTRWKIREFLNGLTTIYYMDMVMEWIENKIER